MTMIEIRNVTKRYGPATVVDNVSMSVEKGEITVIVGTSGSGKSTLMRMINRLVPITEGEISVGGQNVMDVPVTELRRKIGYAIQGHGLFPHRTVAQNIATVPQLLDWDSARIAKRVEELLGLFNLDPATFADKYPHQLSGGQQQRVGVARALAAEPELLLMDEPFGALDPVIRGKAQDDLLAIQKQFGTTVILVTHDMDEAFHLGNQIAVMSQGRLLQCSTPEKILTEPADPFVQQLTGTSDRALKLMSLLPLKESMEPAKNGLAYALPQSLSLRDALAEMIWQGVDEAAVQDGEKAPVGSISMTRLLELGRKA
ncbi:ABC transporter ATP-binding protein [Rhizobium leguminosarum]|jgi:osmoprotectant transport system ATP-binding protein|uniref:ABC transporter ATP-binding protein n=2 Tax=Rhizobium TaxID=379 RepID=A0A444IKL6_RHILE|nr:MULTISPECIES: ABC transporter ATP-binding protein [Rhizobium]MDH6663513.1 osmoprotectant transport system ATP-binding protein [Rhizobium sophorae]ASS54629.1 amino acid ABC transporter ATP-binding protein [Rhizobium leguminosarum bv. viciae]AVC48054.1 putative ATPase of the ABC class family protein [Rhizobium leguminosarum bv. viciae]MBA8831784.1 osmoprotectant transport system ATP-binding protein [Rhizobium leguminosarum]MBB4328240.1 osmoprotectant transport system ATP-binding protein [Rhiz